MMDHELLEVHPRTYQQRFVVTAIAVAGLVGAGALVYGIGAVFVLVASGEPYRLTINPEGSQARVQFEQPDQHLVSPHFPVQLVLQQAQVVDLQAGYVVLPHGVIEFADTTILPGRFKVRIGAVLFDVMERGIIVSGQEYAWRRR